jgi:hypothetical protein
MLSAVFAAPTVTRISPRLFAQNMSAVLASSRQDRVDQKSLRVVVMMTSRVSHLVVGTRCSAVC